MSTVSKRITGVKVILNIAQPIVVFQCAGYPDIVRNPKQALTDLTNSGRAFGITSVTDPRFVSEIHKTVGADLTGDLRAYKAGDEYVITEDHPALTDRNHKLFGTVKVGEKLKAEKDGVWVEGFLSIPQTMLERQLDANATMYATVMMQFMGINAPVYSAPVTESFVPEGVDNNPEKELIDEAVGKGNKAGK